MRVGIVGLGFGRYGYLEACRGVPRIEVVAICGRDKSKALRYAEELGVPTAYGDASQMMGSEKLDAVIVSIPPDAQVPILLEALSKGLAVFASKPLAPNMEGARQVREAVIKAGVTNMMDFIFPEIPSWRRCRQLLHEGRIGTLRHVAVTWQMESYDNRHGIQTWKTDSLVGGGVTQHFGSHLAHNIEWFLGPIDSISAGMSSAADLRRPGDSHLGLWATSKAGVSISATLCNASKGINDHSWKFFGSAGSLTLVNESPDPVRGFRLCRLEDRRSWDETMADPPLADGKDPRVPLLAVLIDRFAAALATGGEVRPSIEDGVRSQVILRAIGDASKRLTYL